MFPAGEDIADYDLGSLVTTVWRSALRCFYLWYYLIITTLIYGGICNNLFVYGASAIFFGIWVIKYSARNSSLRRMLSDISEYCPEEKHWIGYLKCLTYSYCEMAWNALITILLIWILIASLIEESPKFPPIIF